MCLLTKAVLQVDDDDAAIRVGFVLNVREEVALCGTRHARDKVPWDHVDAVQVRLSLVVRRARLSLS